MKTLFSRLASVLLIALAWSICALCGEIHNAARAGDLAKVKELLRDHPELISSRDDEGYTPLHRAVLMDDKNLVKLLLIKGAEVNAYENSNRTPLH